MTGSLKSLEYGKVLRRIADLAVSSAGAASVVDLRPGWTPEISGRLMGETLAAASLLESGVVAPAALTDPLIEICSILQEGELMLDPVQLRTAGETFRGIREFLDGVASVKEDIRDLSPLTGHLDNMDRTPDSGDRLLAMTTPDGDLSPSASRDFARLLKQVENLRKRLTSRIQGICNSLSGSGALRDMPPTLRDGRYVLPVIASRKGDVRGIVHDRSESGETIFIEPSSLVEEGNALREASLDLDYERRRILREATAELREQLPALRECAFSMAFLDAVYARARYHLETATVFPEKGSLSLQGLRHPLIPQQEMVPNTVELPGDWKVLIVSGPNAGGKSVLLKAVGLAVACAQSGIGCPAGAGSTMPFFGRLHVSIGDQQSIADHQSTYSARLMEQLGMINAPGPGSLALIDEPAAGTDPLTGAALAASVLERLADSGCRVIVTTHQGQLKSLAQGRDGFYNGCMNFRKDTLEPDYTFVPGIPGSSFTLEIARRMSFPEDVLSRAQALSADSFRLDRMLEEVTASRDALRSRLSEAERQSRESLEEMNSRMEELERERRELSASREKVLDDFRQLERSINSRADSLLSKLAKSESAEERRQLREKLRSISRVAGTEEKDDAIDTGDRGGDIRTGDWVSVDGWSGVGRVEEVGEDHVAVTMGNLRLRKPPEEVRRVQQPEEKPASAGWSSPVEAQTELDLRGLSAEEALDELDRAVEDGLVAGIPFIRIIHGKGRGILMKAVVDLVRGDSRIETFRPGKPSEGGTGVTVVHLRQPAKGN